MFKKSINNIFLYNNNNKLKQLRYLSLSLNYTCSKLLNQYSLKNPEEFWSETSQNVTWFKKYNKVS